MDFEIPPPGIAVHVVLWLDGQKYPVMTFPYLLFAHLFTGEREPFFAGVWAFLGDLAPRMCARTAAALTGMSADDESRLVAHFSRPPAWEKK